MSPVRNYDEIRSEVDERVREPAMDIDHVSRTHVMQMHAKEMDQWMLYHSLFGMVGLENQARMFAGIATEEDEHGVMLASLLNPAMTPLEKTLAVEQALIEGYADFALTEPDDYVKTIFNYIIADHVEHARLIADWIRQDGGDPEFVTQGALELQEGRSLSMQHVDVEDTIKRMIPAANMNPLSGIHTSLTLSAEKNAWIGYHEAITMVADRNRRMLLAEMAQVEHQHATMIHSLMDPTLNPLQRALFNEFTEVSAYSMFIEQEKDDRVRSVFEYTHREDAQQLSMIRSELERSGMGEAFKLTGRTERLPMEAPEMPAGSYVSRILAEQRETISQGKEFTRRAA